MLSVVFITKFSHKKPALRQYVPRYAQCDLNAPSKDNPK